MSDNKPLPRILCPVCGSTWIEYRGAVGSDRHNTDSFKCNAGHMFSITTDRDLDRELQRHLQRDAIEQRNRRESAGVSEGSLGAFPPIEPAMKDEGVVPESEWGLDEQFRSAADAIEFEKAKEVQEAFQSIDKPLDANDWVRSWLESKIPSLGLTALDVFAIAAMQGLVHDILIDQHCEDVLMKNGLKTEEFHDFLANMSYDVATSMLAEKKRREGNPVQLQGFYDIKDNCYKCLVSIGDHAFGFELVKEGNSLKPRKAEDFGVRAEIELRGGEFDGQTVTFNI